MHSTCPLNELHLKQTKFNQQQQQQNKLKSALIGL